MKRLLAVLSCLIVWTALTPSGMAADDWSPLFDGKSLEGWTVRGGYAAYKAADGMIIGTTAEGSPNSFLCKGPFTDFELEFEVKCDPELNSGVQIRSHVYEKDTPQASKPDRIRPSGTVYGYQCEIAKASSGVSGNFWDEARWTRWHDDFSGKPKAQKAFRHNDWNKYRIVANGKHIQSWVNDVPCADFKDDMDASGFIGLQVHGIKKGTGPYQVRWRNIRIRPLNAD